MTTLTTPPSAHPRQRRYRARQRDWIARVLVEVDDRVIDLLERRHAHPRLYLIQPIGNDLSKERQAGSTTSR